MSRIGPAVHLDTFKSNPSESYTRRKQRTAKNPAQLTADLRKVNLNIVSSKYSRKKVSSAISCCASVGVFASK